MLRRGHGSTQEDGQVILAVEDSGLGIDPKKMDTIFDAFVTTKPNGMGMGLPIVRSIVEAHGGKLSAENTEDGARFCFRLPAAPGSEAEEVA